MRDIIENGLSYPLVDLPEEQRKEDLEFMIQRGNHKYAKTPEVNARTLKKNCTKEVEQGRMLPVSLKCLRKVKGAAVILVGVHTQEIIGEHGETKVKRKTTHDTSFPPPSNQSTIDRLIRELLTDCQYGHCFLKVLHNIHMMRLTRPGVRVLIIKLDLDSAYGRLHVLIRMALLAITIIQKMAYVLLRLPFGVANGPSD